MARVYSVASELQRYYWAQGFDFKTVIFRQVIRGLIHGGTYRLAADYTAMTFFPRQLHFRSKNGISKMGTRHLLPFPSCKENKGASSSPLLAWSKSETLGPCHLSVSGKRGHSQGSSVDSNITDYHVFNLNLVITWVSKVLEHNSPDGCEMQSATFSGVSMRRGRKDYCQPKGISAAIALYLFWWGLIWEGCQQHIHHPKALRACEWPIIVVALLWKDKKLPAQSNLLSKQRYMRIWDGRQHHISPLLIVCVEPAM